MSRVVAAVGSTFDTRFEMAATSELEEPLIPFDEESNASSPAVGGPPSAKSFFPLALKVFFMMAITISVVYLMVTVSDADVMSGNESRKNTGGEIKFVSDRGRRTQVFIDNGERAPVTAFRFD